jgi:hypothetical protein
MCRFAGATFVAVVEGRGGTGPHREERIMKQYLLSVHMVEGQEPPTPEAMTGIYADVNVFNDELQASDAWVFAGGLHPPDTATVVWNQAGEVLITDGPFAETKEQLGGFWIITAADLDAALAWAAKGSRACRNPVEVRPFQEAPTD